MEGGEPAKTNQEEQFRKSTTAGVTGDLGANRGKGGKRKSPTSPREIDGVWGERIGLGGEKTLEKWLKTMGQNSSKKKGKTGKVCLAGNLTLGGRKKKTR